MNPPRSESLDSEPLAPALILGGSGFIGTQLTTLLTARQVSVRIGDLKPSEAFPALWTRCNVRQRESLAALARGASAIVNLVAEHRDDVRPLCRYHEANVEGAAQVCLAARNAGIRTIVFTSSVAVYGFHPGPVDENGPFAPSNAYGKSKVEAEGVYRAWAAEDPSRTLVIVRPAVVFGEGNRGNVYTLMRQIAAGRFLMVGSGNNVKSMAYVGNVAAFLAHTLSLGPGTHVFNYVDGPDMSTGELVEHIRLCLGRTGKTASIPRPLALAGGHLMDLLARLSGRTFPLSAVRVHKFCASTQFRAELAVQSGFIPPYSLREALARTVQFEFRAK
jgi:nucleoside-diphosphate-sugar epimerase